VVGAGQVELAVVGDFDPAVLKQGVQKALGGWPVSVAFERIPVDPVEARPGRLSFTTPDKQNAALSVLLPVAMNDDDPDATALTMATYLLGNGGRSRLWDRIREREGLSYNVYATLSLSSLDRQSWWVGGAIFAPGNRAKVEAAFREEIERARAQGFTAKELEEGKSGLLGFRALSRAQDGTLAAAWARNLYLGRTFARSAQVDAQIRNLTLEQVNAAFRKYVDPGKLLWGVAGDFKE
jgi:zinc protease